jgi:hypothetical protein
MGYRFQITPDAALYRSRHTGEWGLFVTNAAYGYDAAQAYYGERLGVAEIAQAAQIAGADPAAAIRIVEEGVRAGGSGMRPLPDFTFTEGATV